MFYVVFGEQALFSVSTEILISEKQGCLLTTPTAGAIMRV
jgi:anthranilate/para-aminobenzoate synthase component I